MKATKPGIPGFVSIEEVNIINIMVNKNAITKYMITVPGGRFSCHTLGLSICRNPAQPASSRSKAVDSMAAHSFQTVRHPGCVSPVSAKPDRFYYYEDYDRLLFY